MPNGVKKGRMAQQRTRQAAKATAQRTEEDHMQDFILRVLEGRDAAVPVPEVKQRMSRYGYDTDMRTLNRMIEALVTSGRITKSLHNGTPVLHYKR